jgi:hypothetical protein
MKKQHDQKFKEDAVAYYNTTRILVLKAVPLTLLSGTALYRCG